MALPLGTETLDSKGSDYSSTCDAVRISNSYVNLTSQAGFNYLIVLQGKVSLIQKKPSTSMK